MGKYDFQTSNIFLVPLVAVIIPNMASLLGGILRVIFVVNGEKMFAQVFISFYALVMSFPVVEGMLMRKDKGRIQPSTVLLSAMFSAAFWFLGSMILLF